MDITEREKRLNDREKSLIEFELSLINDRENLQKARENLQKECFDKSLSYTSTIISIGYVSIFILLTTLKDKISFNIDDLSVIAYCLIISISAFITWEVVNMIIRAFEAGIFAHVQKSFWLKVYFVFWILVLLLTTITAGIVIYKLLRILFQYMIG